MFYFDFGYLSKNISEKWRKTAKIKDAEKKKKKKNDILTRTVSTGVFTNSVFFCVSLNFAFFWKRYKNGASAKSKEKESKKIQLLNVKIGPSISKKIGPSMLRNIIGPVFHL